MKRIDCLGKAENTNADTHSKSGDQENGLAVVTVGATGPSIRYVGKKLQKGNDLGINTLNVDVITTNASGVEYPVEEIKNDIASTIVKLNNDPEVNSIILQLPLPGEVSEFTDELLDLIAPEKDVDGLGVIATGKLLRGTPSFVPATVQATDDILHMVAEKEGTDARDYKVLVIGRGKTIGAPLIAHLIANRQALVMCANSRTDKIDLESMIMESDVVVSAVDTYDYFDAGLLRGKILIDVGITFDENGKIRGTCTEAHRNMSKYYTKTPGGVGPMTVANLFANVVKKR